MENRTREERARYLDAIAEQYGRVQPNTMLPRCYSEVYTLVRILGDIAGKSGLDLGCSDGFFTRVLKRQGAAPVCGVDSSARMIELALEEEGREPLGIRYLLRDVLELDVVGEVDVVLGAYLLNFAQTTDELRAICRTVSANLKPGGRFVALVDHPTSTAAADERFAKYGLVTTFTPPLSDGARIEVTLIPAVTAGDAPSRITFATRYFTQTTIESALREAGLRRLRWHALRISPAGLRRFGPEFWRDYLEQPSSAFVEGWRRAR